MADASFDNIPSLDLEDFRSGNNEKRTKFVAALGNTFNHVGFVAIKNHGLSDELRHKLYQAIQDFFTLPEAVKKQYDSAEFHGQRGYTSKGKEHAKGRSTGDLKEFYQIGQIVENDDPVKEVYPDNIWPSELPEMQQYASRAFKTLESAGQQILKAVALYLKLPEDYFDAKVHNGNSILRAIHYFPIEDPDSIPADAVRAAEHGDINLITLLMGASAEGLEIQRRDGKWFPVTALPEQIVVNVGDMLARLTNDKLKSTIHRVVNPPKEKMKTSRYSIPFFLHPRSDMDLTCLDSCISAEQPKQYTNMTAGEFLDERLAEIGLKK
ncbi:isopenicillin N synthase family dioxygenase [Catalinimonas niigatensis]|uniref:isopenicillin N synthase family dioxygenase n=1 Tax=Catalinimonas niigatensis TaxID=1397264 RepID=UPI0026671170|nr:2-oxoglutarate and iron-dependent oxygenase domain-containing protein [Catalinimonas niigatensis]WPP53336.1 2-oxoglutarate and iron-dependent oxygenase domain-containing protein [Catalinimonas niigatensis]